MIFLVTKDLLVVISSGLFVCLDYISVVGDSPITRIMDLPKENINQELRWESSIWCKHFAFLRVRWTKKTSSKTWIHLCCNSYLRVKLFIYWPQIIGHNNGHIDLLGYLMPNSFLYIWTVLFQRISLAWVHSLSKTILFQTI